MTHPSIRRPTSLVLFEDEDPRPRQIALLAAILLHLLLISLTFPSWSRREPSRPIACVRSVPLILLPPVEMLRTQVRPVMQEELGVRPIPIPDPEPERPEPVHEAAVSASALPANLVTGIASLLPPVEAPPISLLYQPGFGEVTYPELIRSSRVKPRYPSAARLARLEGQVILRAVVHADGTVGRLEVLRQPPGDVGFAEAAIDAVRRWRYRPGSYHGRPVDVHFTIVVDFVLQ